MFFKEGWGLMIPIYLESHLRIMNIKLSGVFLLGMVGKKSCQYMEKIAKLILKVGVDFINTLI